MVYTILWEWFIPPIKNVFLGWFIIVLLTELWKITICRRQIINKSNITTENHHILLDWVYKGLPHYPSYNPMLSFPVDPHPASSLCGQPLYVPTGRCGNSPSETSKHCEPGFSWLEPGDVQKMADKLLPQAGWIQSGYWNGFMSKHLASQNPLLCNDFVMF